MLLKIIFEIKIKIDASKCVGMYAQYKSKQNKKTKKSFHFKNLISFLFQENIIIIK